MLINAANRVEYFFTFRNEYENQRKFMKHMARSNKENNRISIRLFLILKLIKQLKRSFHYYPILLYRYRS